MPFFKVVSEQEKVDFVKSFSVMLKAGIPIDECLASIAEQSKNKKFSQVLRKVKTEVEYGNPLSVAFAKQEKVFGKIFASLVKAGEASGALEDNFIFLADWLERNNDLRQEIKAATFYPKFIIMASLVMAFTLSAYVLPKLVPLFRDLKVSLPLTTKILLAFSVFVQHNFYLTIITIVLVILFFKYIFSLARVRRAKDWTMLRLWLIGDLVVDYNLAIICQVLTVLIRGGLSLGEILESAEQSVSNEFYSLSLTTARRQTSRGVRLSDSLSKYPKLYPRNFLSIIATGEESGSLDSSLSYLTEYYAKEVLNKTKKLPALIEPVLLVVIAAGVLFIALSIVMPIYSLTQGLGR